MPPWLVPTNQRFYTYRSGKGPNAAKPGPNQHAQFVRDRGWMIAPGAGPAPPPAATAAVPATKPKVVARKPVVGSDPWSTFLSMIGGGPGSSWADVQKQARVSVNDQIKLALADQKRAYDQARIEGEVQAQGARSAQDAIAAATAGDPAALQAGYLQAADRSRMYGQGLAGDVLAAENANVDRSNAAIQALGAPGGPIAGYDTGALNNAALMRNVVNPGMSLEDQAAGALQLGQGMRTSQLGAANQGVLGIYQKLAELRGKSLADVASLEEKRPTLLSQALSDAQNAWRQNMALYASALSAVGTQAGKTNLATTRTASQKDKERAAQIKATGIDPRTNLAAPGFHRDPNDPAHAKRALKDGWHWDVKTGTVIKDKTPTKGASTGPKLADFQKTRSSMLKGGTARLGLDKTFTAPLNWSRKQIAAYLMNQYGNDFLAAYPGQKARVQAMVNEVATTLYNQAQEKLKRKKK